MYVYVEIEYRQRIETFAESRHNGARQDIFR